MAKVKLNPILEHVSGSLGQDLMLRRLADGRTILCVKPDFSNREFSEKQLGHQQRFRQAAAYAKQAAKTHPIYAELAAGTLKTAYNIALSDWFNPPEILAVHTDMRPGQPGASIQIQARDDVLVTEVTVIISDDTGCVLDHGQASPHMEGEWLYETGVLPNPASTLLIIAKDLPGNASRHSGNYYE